MRARLPKYDGPMRETVQWSLLGSDAVHLRYDILWKDPASGWLQQLCVDQLVPTPIIPSTLEEARRIAAAKFTSMLNKKCGVRAMINRTWRLPLPLTAPFARFV